MALDISPFDPPTASQTELADYYRVIAESAACDQPALPVPSFETVVGHLQTPFEDRGQAKFWRAHKDGTIVGVFEVQLPEQPNRRMALLEAR